jgi:hypothetical protein
MGFLLRPAARQARKARVAMREMGRACARAGQEVFRRGVKERCGKSGPQSDAISAVLVRDLVLQWAIRMKIR